VCAPYFVNLDNNTFQLKTLLFFVHLRSQQKENRTRMWANAKRDGRPAEHRWRPLFNAAKFGWRPVLDCRAVTLPRSESRWNLQGCPKLANRSQPLVGRKFTMLSGHVEEVFLLNSLTSEDIAWQSCAMVPKCRFFASCIFSKPRVAHFRPAF